MLLGLVNAIVTRIVTYNEKSLFYKTYKEMLTEEYCQLVSPGRWCIYLTSNHAGQACEDGQWLSISATQYKYQAASIVFAPPR